MSTKKRGQIFCLDADTGKTLWQNDGGMGDNVALVSAGSAIVLLTNSGQLVFFKPTATGYDPIKQYKVAEGSTWAHPVLLDGRILIKDGATLKSWSWRN